MPLEVHKPLHPCKGFTVVEAVVASAIMAFVFLAILGAMSYGRRTASVVENRLAALHAARETLEALSALSYSSPSLNVGTNSLAGKVGSYAVTENNTKTLKDVVVTVSWVEPLGKTESVTLTTSISKSLHK